MRHTLIGFVFIASLFASQEILADLEFKECRVSKGALSVDAQCASFERLENPADENGKTIAIEVVKFPARTPEPAADAFTIIQGGPGMSSIDLFLQLRPIMYAIQAKRDVIVVDQRGTGRSNMLTCEIGDDTYYADFDEQATKQVAKDCVASLDSDLRFYTTSVAVQDLEAIRQAAGYAQLSVYGVSYGTRVAQHYARRYPTSIRALVLDGVADISLNLAGSEISKRSQQALEKITKRCKKEQDCIERLGDVKANFEAVRARLKANPIELEFAHPNHGSLVSMTLTEQHLLGAVRLMPYSTESLALMPLVLSQAHEGNYQPLAAQALLGDETFKQDYAFAMNNSVVCAEDYPFLTAQDLLGQSDTYLGDMFAQSLAAMCSVWPKGQVDDDFRAPFESNIPTLLMSGEFDPITPPENAERALQQFSNAAHVVVPNHGHGVVARGCVPQLLSEFIESASLQEFDSSCVQRERAQPLFVSPAGPTP